MRFRTLALLTAVIIFPLSIGCDEGEDDVNDIETAEDEADDDYLAAVEDEGEWDDWDSVELCDAKGDERTCDGGTQFCDVIVADLIWGPCLTNVECTPGESRDCGLGEEFGDIAQPCVLEQGVPRWMEDACNTPLVLSFDGSVEVEASSYTFDINGAGGCISTDWPTARTPWLATDLDKNGSIEGNELFGTGTTLSNGRHARNGFLALAELDSNGDGKITETDTRFSELVLWSDYDSNRRSTFSELEPLNAFGISSIDLGYSTNRTCDARHNCAVERAAFELSTGQTGHVIDVHLACQ